MQTNSLKRVVLFAVVAIFVFAAASFGLSPVMADTSAIDASPMCTAATPVIDGFNSIASGWVTDRFAPNAFQSTSFNGDNRLEIQIDNAQASVNRGPSYNSTFYNTQGKKMSVSFSGQWNASADVYVSADMLSGNNLRRTDMWLRVGDGTEPHSVYHILGIVRMDAADPWNPNAANLETNWRVYDSDVGGTGWVVLPGPTSVGWYTLKMVGNADQVRYYINNVLVYSDATVNSAYPDLTEVFFQAYNFSNTNQSNSGQNYSVYWDNLDIHNDCASITLTAPSGLLCGAPVEMSINFDDVPNLYGYEFKVNYNATYASAAGAFDNHWFDTLNGLVVPGWGAACASGTCQFGASLQAPQPAVSTTAPERVGKITFTPAGAGPFTAALANVTLSDIDGFPIPVNLDDADFAFTTCGNATVSGKISLQGRVTPGNDGWVTLIDTTTGFPPVTVPFNASGNYTASVPVMPTGSAYKLQAFHYLYLANEKAAQTLMPGQTLANQNTRLLGGDANNSGLVPPYTGQLGVTTTDVGCIGASFGLAPVNCSDANGSTDINNDTFVNIQDLSIAGGNFNKNPFQAW